MSTMKTLKFDHKLAALILNDEKTSTWRINDDKELSVDDVVVIIDKVDPHNKNSWVAIGEATISEVIEKRLGDVDPRAGNDNETHPSKHGMFETFRQYHGDSVDEKTPLKIIHFTFKLYKHEKQLEAVEDKSTTALTEVKLYGDGGSRGNPGHSASGFALLDMSDNIIMKRGVYLGITTNNQAEYKSLKFGMEEALKRGVKVLHVYMDSLLVINQMLGKYKVRNRDLWPIHDAIKKLVPKFEHVTFIQVPRELNKLADSMVNDALDKELRR